MAWARTMVAVRLLAVALAVVAFQALPAAAQAPGQPSAQIGTSTPVPLNLNPLGPPLPEPGQASQIPWQSRLRWLQQQLVVLGQDPGPEQELFRQLGAQAEAIVAAIPGIQDYQPAAAPVTDTSAGAVTTARAGGAGAGGTAGQAQGPIRPASPPGAPPPSQPPPGPQPPGPPPAGALPAATPQDPVAMVFHLAREMERTVRNPMQATILAVYGIVDAAKDDPQMGIQSLQALLEGETALPSRTAIRFALKDLMLKAGDRQGAIQQLQQIAAENSRQLRAMPPPRPLAPPPPGGTGVVPGPAPGQPVPHGPAQ